MKSTASMTRTNTAQRGVTRRNLAAWFTAMCIAGGSGAISGCASSRAGTTTEPAPSHAHTHHRAGTNAGETAGFSDDTRAKYVESFDVAWETVRDRHFDPNLGGVDWDGARAELRPRIQAARSVSDARSVLSELLARLKQTHFGIIPREAYEHIGAAAGNEPAEPSGSPQDFGSNDASSRASTGVNDQSAGDSVGPGDGVLGVRVRVIDAQPLIVRVQPGSDAERQGLRSGFIIESIDSRPTGQIIRAVEESSTGSGSPALWSAMAGRAIESRLNGRVGSRVRVGVIDDRGELREIVAARTAPPGSPATVANLPKMYVEFESKRVAPRIGYTRLSIFLDPPTINPLFTDAVQEFADSTDGMIIDLRGNPGGLGLMAIGFGGQFIDERGLKLGTMKTRGGELKFVLNPRARPYTRPLAILVDEGSLSTSEILAGGMQDLKRARIFGVQTGGAALPSVIQVLPSGDAMQFAIADYVSANGRHLEGEGVSPDEVVKPTRTRLLNGHDPELEAAMDWIRSQPGG